jgi:hypothetical protein
MRSRRLAVLAALAAAALAAAGAGAAPLILPQTQQCDGSFATGGSTHRPNPAVQAIVQDATGLRVGQATMGATNKGFTYALWRFDSGVTVSDAGCSSDIQTYDYTYQDSNGSPSMLVGECVYDTSAGCGPAASLRSSPMVPLGLSACPAPPISVGPTSIFPAGQFGNAATFDGSAVQYGSITFVNNTFFDRGATYTLSAWIKSNSATTQRIVSQQNGPDWWGFGIGFDASANIGLRLFDSRNINGGIGDLRDVTIADAAIADNTWHKIDVVRINGSQERFYDNGAFIGAVPASSTVAFTSRPLLHPMMIGICDVTICPVAREQFSGSIDEIRVADAALSDDDIRLEYLGSNVHRFASAPGNALAEVIPGGLAASNGDTGAMILTPPIAESPIPTASAPNFRWIFEAQNTQTVTTVASTFTVVIDQTAPTAPSSVAGTPNSGTTNAITWSWTPPAHYC